VEAGESNGKQIDIIKCRKYLTYEIKLYNKTYRKEK